MATLAPIVYLTIEIKNRELDSRAMIACHLVSAGVTVVIGQQWSIFENLSALPKGAILFKTVNKIQARIMARFYKFGHFVAATDEEVLLCTSGACFCSGFSDLAADNCHLFLAQSEAHKQAVEDRFPQILGHTQVTGNPRVDSTSIAGREQYRNEATEIASKMGPFLLFNANFASINSIWESVEKVAAICTHAGVLDPADPTSVALFNANIDWEYRNRVEMVALLKWAVTNVTSHKIVIRPHPGEKIEFWQELFGDCPNVMIVGRSHHMPWILAADVVIHTSCTTGLEAALLDKPVLNLTPAADPAWGRMTSKVNPCFADWNAGAAALQMFLETRSGPLADITKYKAALEAYFPGHHEGISARNIAKSLVDALNSHDVTRDPNFKWDPASTGFKRISRPPQTVDKMSTGLSEFRGVLEDAMRRSGLVVPTQISKLDDSLFMLSAV